MAGRKSKNIQGIKYNYLTALGLCYINKYNKEIWLFECECGNKKQIAKER